jgi:hypothetical protein
MKNHHFMMSYVSHSVIVLLLLFLSLPVGCTKSTTENEKVVAVVNDEPVLLEDFEREISLRSKQNPAYKITPTTLEGQLDTIIDRKLMIQEAMKMGLAGNADFVRTIQSFWEQTLIRELIENKNDEWEKRLFVTEQEIRDYYDKATQMATFSLYRTKDEKRAVEVLKKTENHGDAPGWEVIGPVAYHDVPPFALADLFDMAEGEKKMLRDGDEFIVIYLMKKEIHPLPPLNKIQGQVKREVLERKKTEALEEWLAQVREKADIDINKEIIERYLEVNKVTHNVGSGYGR